MKQKINCNVCDCRHNDCSYAECTLSCITVTPVNNDQSAHYCSEFCRRYNHTED